MFILDRFLKKNKIDIVSITAHEFRTYLTSIINYLSVLSSEAKEKLSPEEQIFLDRAFVSAQQLSYLVDNLLDVSRIERGVLTVNIQPLDWKKQLTQTVGNSKLQALQKKIDLRLNLPSEPIPPITADLVRINEVLNNLIVNAINYTNEGGIIEVGTKLAGSEIVTYVADNGRGIPKEAMPHLFSKFFRAEATHGEVSKGTGLGLYISKTILDLHHGRIWVKSEEGKGSIFYFSLPVIITSQPPKPS
ncbi:MAG: HAMP domain-containing sensor histidine kinase [Candidatus Daviesbacteria bacterium]